MHSLSLKRVRGRLMNIHEFRNMLIRVSYAVETQRTYNALKRTRNANSQDKYMSFSVSTPNFIGI